MKMIAMILGLMVGASVHASTVCTNSEGTIQYLFFEFANAKIDQSIEIRSGERVLSRSIVNKDKSVELGPISPNLTDIKPFSDRTVSECLKTAKFTAKLALEQNPDNLTPVSDIQLPYTADVTCRQIIDSCH